MRASALPLFARTPRMQGMILAGRAAPTKAPYPRALRVWLEDFAHPRPHEKCPRLERIRRPPF